MNRQELIKELSTYDIYNKKTGESLTIEIMEKMSTKALSRLLSK